MVQYNFATELCMTRGQEGYVHGWQSKIGKKKKLVLGTLSVELIKPPTEVQMIFFIMNNEGKYTFFFLQL